MRRCSRRRARSTGSRPSRRRTAPRFYGLPLNEGTVTLERAEVDVPDEIDGLVPFHAGETLRWRLACLNAD